MTAAFAAEIEASSILPAAADPADFHVLRPGGRFFSYTPSKASDAFKDPGPSKAIDSNTLDGIRRKDAPFCGNFYPFRFVNSEDYAAPLNERGLRVAYNETVGRTYRSGAEDFEFVVIVGGNA